jgi:hypothetical protein
MVSNWASGIWMQKMENERFGQNRKGRLSRGKPRPNLRGCSAKEEEEKTISTKYSRFNPWIYWNMLIYSNFGSSRKNNKFLQENWHALTPISHVNLHIFIGEKNVWNKHSRGIWSTYFRSSTIFQKRFHDNQTERIKAPQWLHYAHIFKLAYSAVDNVSRTHK